MSAWRFGRVLIRSMIYMSSQATGDGNLALSITFALGTDLSQAQVLVQNRVALAEPRLPEDVRRIGVAVRKSSPDLMMVIHLSSHDGSRDPDRSEEHTSELQSLMRISYAVFCL